MINFNEENHTYTNDSGKELISVTTLLKKAGISPNYDFVKKEVLTAASETKKSKIGLSIKKSDSQKNYLISSLT